MESWQWTALLLCGFGLFKEFRPSESFFTEYLIEYKNITSDVLIHNVYPVWTYSYLGTLAIVFLITDFVRYRAIVILEGLAFVVCWATLTWGQSLAAIYGVEATFGLAGSTEVAYYTYIYAKVEKEHYKKVTSYTYSAIFVGRFLGSVLAQILVSFELMNYHELNYISLTCVSIAFMFSLFLPSVKQSVYFNRNCNSDSASGDLSMSSKTSCADASVAFRPVPHVVDGNGRQVPTPTKAKSLSFISRVRKAYPILWTDFKTAYSNYYVIRWSLWWAIAMAGHLQIINYIQALWEVIAPDKYNNIYNGGVEAIQCGLSAILAFAVGHVKIPWNKYGESLLCIISLMEGGSIVWMSQTENLMTAYALYIIFRVCFQVTITIASAEIAQKISEDSYGLIFGVNTFVALSLQTILTVIVADEAGLALKERNQFLVYGVCYGVLGAMFVLAVMYSLLANGCRLNPLPLAHDCAKNGENEPVAEGGTN